MKIQANFERVTGKIRPLHGVGQPPFTGINFDMFSYLRDANIPFSRLHDVGGAYGGFRWVDIPNLFRDFNADPLDPASYDFTFTDLMITALIENGVEPFFRLGVTIENNAKIKSYRLDPPSDYHKWSVICEHVIRHYTEGWANGFRYNIRYWEIWNEPDNYEDPLENQMWKGTKEQYYNLYEVASKHLKACFPHLKIGGYASCGFYAIKKQFVKEANSSPRKEYFIEFFDGFLDHVKKTDSPFDFFSWHTYSGLESNSIYADYARKRLDEAGFEKTESICNEWNPHPSAETRGTYLHAAETCATMLAWQKIGLDSAMFYDARFGVSIYGSLFHPETKRPYPTYYAFKAFGELYRRGEEVELHCDEEAVFSVAARDENSGCIVIANPTDAQYPLELQTNGSVVCCKLTANGKNEKDIPLPTSLPAHGILEITLSL